MNWIDGFDSFIGQLTKEKDMSRLNGYDRWLESPYNDDNYPEQEELAHDEAMEMLQEGEQFYPFSASNWMDAASELKMDEEVVDDMSLATDEQKQKVFDYWYKIAFNICLD